MEANGVDSKAYNGDLKQKMTDELDPEIEKNIGKTDVANGIIIHQKLLTEDGQWYSNDWRDERRIHCQMCNQQMFKRQFRTHVRHFHGEVSYLGIDSQFYQTEAQHWAKFIFFATPSLVYMFLHLFYRK